VVRFLADASLHDGIVSGCLRREPTMDFLSANEAKLEGVSDPDVLALAAREDRIVVTSDASVQLASESGGRTSPRQSRPL